MEIDAAARTQRADHRRDRAAAPSSSQAPVVRRSLACAALVAALLGTWPQHRAAASCVGPTLAVGPVTPEGTAPTPATMELDAVVTVHGEWFRTGCDDTGQGSGCGAPASEEAPMREVALHLAQGEAASATLGVSDADDRQDRYGVRWSFRVPPGFRPGPAELSAGGSALSVELVSDESPPPARQSTANHPPR